MGAVAGAAAGGDDEGEEEEQEAAAAGQPTAAGQLPEDLQVGCRAVVVM
jgi:hypothetical protein